MKKLWLIYFESANYAGAGEHCVAMADSEEDAHEMSHDHREDFYCDQDYDQFVDENGGDDDVGSWSTIVYCREFDESNEYWKYYIDPRQESFYPKIGF